MRRLVLAVETHLVEGLFAASDDPVSVESLVGTTPLWMGPREHLETDERFRQLIPYVILRTRDSIVIYRRTINSSESRLHGEYSIGVGGHIELEDLVMKEDVVCLVSTLGRAGQREVYEELGLNVQPAEISWLGVVSDNASAVGRVHLGIVGIVELSADSTPSSGEDALSEVALVSIDELEDRARSGDLEEWSKLAVGLLNSNKQPYLGTRRPA